jgi:hypothetical protein
MASRPSDERAAPSGAAPRSSHEPSELDLERLVAELESPGVLLRVRVLRRRQVLDEALAHGASPSSTVELALRARQLVSNGSRRRAAASIEKLVDMAQRARCLTGVPIARKEILELRPVLLGLAASLRTEGPVYARGMALLSVLLTSASSPIYAVNPGQRVHAAIQASAEALDGNLRGGGQQ